MLSEFCAMLNVRPDLIQPILRLIAVGHTRRHAFNASSGQVHAPNIMDWCCTMKECMSYIRIRDVSLGFRPCIGGEAESGRICST